MNANVVRLKLEHAGPVLDCAFTADGKRSVSGGLAKSVLMCVTAPSAPASGAGSGRRPRVTRRCVQGMISRLARSLRSERTTRPSAAWLEARAKVCARPRRRERPCSREGRGGAVVTLIPFPVRAGHVFTAGWDSRLCRWDPRASDAGAGAVALPDKALTMDADGKQFVAVVQPPVPPTHTHTLTSCARCPVLCPYTV